MKKNISGKGKACKEDNGLQKAHREYFSHEPRISQDGFRIPTTVDYRIRIYMTDTTADFNNLDDR